MVPSMGGAQSQLGAGMGPYNGMWNMNGAFPQEDTGATGAVGMEMGGNLLSHRTSSEGEPSGSKGSVPAEVTVSANGFYVSNCPLGVYFVGGVQP